MGVSVTILHCGMLDADRSVIHPGDDSHRRVTLPIPALLIRGERTVLIDTGCPPVAAGNPEGLEREYGIEPQWITSRIEIEQRVDAQLLAVGLRPADLDMVIATHFHFDHAGGNALFAGIVPVTVQSAELEAAREGDYLPVWDAPGMQFDVVEGDWSPMPDLEMLHTPGHTPGHQSVLVRLEERPWLFTIDVVYTEEHWRQDVLGAVEDVPTARASMERLRSIATREDARIVFGHDIGQWDTLEKAPASYR